MKNDHRIRSWEITSETNYLDRRSFLRTAGVAAGAAVGGAVEAAGKAGEEAMDTVKEAGESAAESVDTAFALDARRLREDRIGDWRAAAVEVSAGRHLEPRAVRRAARQHSLKLRPKTD